MTNNNNQTEAEAPKNIMEIITSHQAALDYNGETLEQFEYRTERDTPGQKAGKMLEDIALALNEGKPLTEDDAWYYPWFRRTKTSAGPGLSFDDYGIDLGGSNVGSRLCVNSSPKARFFGGENFTSLWVQYTYSR